MTNRGTIIAFALFLCTAAGSAEEILTRGGSLSVDVADDASLLIDLAGALWVVPPGGGDDLVAPGDADDTALAGRGHLRGLG